MRGREEAILTLVGDGDGLLAGMSPRRSPANFPKEDPEVVPMLEVSEGKGDSCWGCIDEKRWSERTEPYSGCVWEVET